ncbi:MAG: c-type cytochrome domain-containing protein [Aureliella sp.]
MVFAIQNIRPLHRTLHLLQDLRYINQFGLFVLLVGLPCFVLGDERVDYSIDIQPIFARNCVACHNSNLAEGGLNLEDHSALAKGGDSGESVVAGQPEVSYLLSRVNGDEEPWMPPDDNAVDAKRLTESELTMIETWIREGAEAGSSISQSMLNLKRPPPRLTPTYDLEFAPDDSFIAYGLGSNAYVLRIDSAEVSQIPSGTPIPLLSRDSAQSTTHLDLVQSIAVSSDSQRVATGGYKQVKLWRQTRKRSEFIRDLVPYGERFELSPNGNHLAYQTGQYSFEIVDLQRGVSLRYLKTHDEPLASITWVDEVNVMTCDAGGQCTQTNIDGQQRRLESDTETVGEILAAERSKAWLYVAHRSIQGKIDLSRRPITVSQNQADWSKVATDVAAGIGSKEPFTVQIAASNGAKMALALGRSISILNCASWNTESRFQMESPVTAIHWNPEGSQLVVAFRDRAPEIRDGASGDLIFSLSQDYTAAQRVRYLEDQLAIRGVQKRKVEEKIPPAKASAERESKAVAKLTEDKNNAATARDKAAAALAETKRQIAELEAKFADNPNPIESDSGNDAGKPVDKEGQGKLKQQIAQKQTSLEPLRSKLTKAEADLAERQQALAAARDAANVTAGRIPTLEADLVRITEEMSNLGAEIKAAQTQSAIGRFQTFESNFGLSSVMFGDEQVVVAQANRLSFFSAADGTPTDTLILDKEKISHLSPIFESDQCLAFTESGRAYAISVDKEWELERKWGSMDQDIFPDRITALDFSPDGRRLAIGSGMPSRGGSVYLVELEDEVDPSIKIWGEDLHSDQVLALSFSPDGQYLASGAADKICRIQEVESSQPFRKLEGHSHHILDISWRWDGQTIATASGDGTTKVWNVDDATQARTLTGLAGENTSVQFVGNTNTLAVVSTAGHARTIDSGNGKVLKSFGGSLQPLFTVAASPSKSLVSAAGQKGSIWIWNADTGKLEAEIKNPPTKEP